MNYLFLIFSVLIGVLIVVWLKPSNKIVRLLLAFSGAYLLSVTILHLLPEVYHHTNDTKQIGIFILAGIVLQFILESFSKGAEHGHIHAHGNAKDFPWLLFVSLCIHAFSEGLPLHSHGHHGHEHNLLWAIVVHKIPIAIVLTTFFLHAKYATKHIIIFLSFFALMSPLGVFLAEKWSFLVNYATQINALIIGVFLHISTIILFESTENHKFNIQKFLAILAGILLTVFTL